MRLCSKVYPPTDRTDHIVVCDLPAGHQGEHNATIWWEDEDEESGE